MLIRKLIFIFGLLLFFSSSAIAGDEDFTHNRASFNASLTSSDSYSLELGYHYMFCRFAGIGGSIGYWSNYYADGRASGPGWSISDDDERPSNLYLRPSVILKTPGVKIRDCRLSLCVEPGIMLNIPYTRVCIDDTRHWPETDYHYISTHGGQWLAMELRCGICADVGPCSFILGYIFSDLDIYSQYRHLRFEGTSFANEYPSKPYQHGAYLSLAYHF